MSGYGFGADDPIRVSGYFEEKRYLDCLRRAGRDAPLKYRRLGSFVSEDTGHPVDVYRVAARGVFQKSVLLYIDIYGERDWRAPAGYALSGPAPEGAGGGAVREVADGLFREVLRLSSIHDAPRDA